MFVSRTNSTTDTMHAGRKHDSLKNAGGIHFREPVPDPEPMATNEEQPRSFTSNFSPNAYQDPQLLPKEQELIVDFMSKASVPWRTAYQFLIARDFNLSKAMALHRQYLSLLSQHKVAFSPHISITSALDDIRPINLEAVQSLSAPSPPSSSSFYGIFSGSGRQSPPPVLPADFQAQHHRVTSSSNLAAMPGQWKLSNDNITRSPSPTDFHLGDNPQNSIPGSEIPPDVAQAEAPLFYVPGSWDKHQATLIVFNARLAGPIDNVENVRRVFRTLHFMCDRACASLATHRYGITFVSNLEYVTDRYTIIEIHRLILDWLQHQLPIRLTSVLCCNAPWWAQRFPFSVRPGVSANGSMLPEIKMCSNLFAYIEPDQLPKQLGGHLTYKHKEWIADQYRSEQFDSSNVLLETDMETMTVHYANNESDRDSRASRLSTDRAGIPMDIDSVDSDNHHHSAMTVDHEMHDAD
ncbi:hypothetical protein BJ742DRAFT_37088 [Cladochytrium replicatum]|nr:hypothetical protein BJ742DRAFT_37088 [Cladochytrium replicatum]